MKKSLSSSDEELAFRLCEDYGKSQANVAKFLGVGQATISRVVNEQRLKQEIQRKDDQLTAAAAAGFKAAFEATQTAQSKVIDVFPSRADLPDKSSGKEG